MSKRHIVRVIAATVNRPIRSGAIALQGEPGEPARGNPRDLEAAGRYLALAERDPTLVPDGRRRQVQVLLGSTRLLIARWHGNLPAAADEALRLQALAEAPGAAGLGLDEELLPAVAAQGPGITELWATRFEEAQRELERSAALAQQIGQPYIEYASLAAGGRQEHQRLVPPAQG